MYDLPANGICSALLVRYNRKSIPKSFFLFCFGSLSNPILLLTNIVRDIPF
jgi:hypothetical protein